VFPFSSLLELSGRNLRHGLTHLSIWMKFMMLQTDIAPPRVVDQTGVGFVSQLVAMVRLLRAARERNVLMGLGAGLLLVIGATAYGQIELNRQLVGATTTLTWVTAGYGWFTIVAPIIVAAPAYFGGDLSFGGLMMAAGAFTQVQQSLRWFVDNTGAIADWRATLLRVGGFRRALRQIDKAGEGASHIDLVTTAEEKLVLQDSEILRASDCIGLSERHVEIAPGEHILVAGAPGSGRENFFRALAGLWRWGKGKIGLPPAEGIMFMPKRA
jgi:ABC-type uncharacterized transport system fused permease/ATPase subunit